MQKANMASLLSKKMQERTRRKELAETKQNLRIVRSFNLMTCGELNENKNRPGCRPCAWPAADWRRAVCGRGRRRCTRVRLRRCAATASSSSCRSWCSTGPGVASRSAETARRCIVFFLNDIFFCVFLASFHCVEVVLGFDAERGQSECRRNALGRWTIPIFFVLFF